MKTWSTLTLLNKAAQFFAKKEIPNSRLEAEILLAHSLSLKRVDLYAFHERVLEKDEVDRFRALVERRIQGEPSAYLTNEKEFFSLPFSVSPAVMIPRPETEDLVQAALDLIPEEGGGTKVADLGTGSGCIVITLCRLRAALKGVAVDASPEALKVAQKNGERHNVQERIQWIHGDFTHSLAPLEKEGPFQLICCNPPYVDPQGPHPADPDVAKWEPREAIFSPLGDSLHFYAKAMETAQSLLHAKGCLLFEMGMEMADSLVRLAESLCWSVIEIRKDLAGIERVISLEKKA